MAENCKLLKTPVLRYTTIYYDEPQLLLGYVAMDGEFSYSFSLSASVEVFEQRHEGSWVVWRA